MDHNLNEHPGLKYFLTDHLGSVIGLLDFNGNIVLDSDGQLEIQRYYPFGAVRSDVGTIEQTDFGFTGQRSNSYINMLDYRSRWYDAQLGRFISPDSIIPDGNQQSLNRYSYVNNDPVNRTDPSGHKACDEEYGCSSPLTKTEPLLSPSSLDEQTVTSTVDNGNSTSSIPIDPTQNKNKNNSQPTIPVDPTQTSQSVSSTVSPVKTPDSQGGKTNWGKIVSGVGIIFAVDVLIVLPIAVGIVLTPGVLEASMLLSEAWVYPVVASVVAVNVYGWNLILEGARGQ